MSTDSDCIARWFDTHVATLEMLHSERSPIERLTWRRADGRGVYAVEYHCWRNVLVVTGDLGAATYMWSSPVSLEWIATCGMQYFASKCEASEAGRDWKDWDAPRAREQIARYWKERERDTDVASDEKRTRFEEMRGDESLDSYSDWLEWLRALGYDVFGDSWYEWAPAVGQVTALRCRAHLEGLQAAMRQLAARPVAA